VADDRRPGVRIELEGRSKGFQWFFSFYLVFLVESDQGHKDALLLLDEPGLHLHPTAQQGLIGFFDKLAEKNQLIYTRHSPFLIDGEHLHRVRPVSEDKTGHSRINAETSPADRETMFPLQAAAGYAMVDYAVLMKLYGGSSSKTAEARYSPAECVGCEKQPKIGNPDWKHISTSYVERQNLTMRMSMRRFTHLKNAFSKELENHSASLAINYVNITSAEFTRPCALLKPKTKVKRLKFQTDPHPTKSAFRGAWATFCNALVGGS